MCRPRTTMQCIWTVSQGIQNLCLFLLIHYLLKLPKVLYLHKKYSTNKKITRLLTGWIKQPGGHVTTVAYTIEYLFSIYCYTYCFLKRLFAVCEMWNAVNSMLTFFLNIAKDIIHLVQTKAVCHSKTSMTN